MLNGRNFKNLLVMIIYKLILYYIQNLNFTKIIKYIDKKGVLRNL